MSKQIETTRRLTERELQQVKLTDHKQRFDDGGGLYLEVMTECPESYRRKYLNLRSGMYWNYEYTLAGQTFVAGIGDYPKMSLDEARRKAAEIAAENAAENAKPKGPLHPLWQKVQIEEDTLRDLLDELPLGLTVDPDAKPNEQSYKDLARARDLLSEANDLIERITEREQAWSPNSGYELPDERAIQGGES